MNTLKAVLSHLDKKQKVDLSLSDDLKASVERFRQEEADNIELFKQANSLAQEYMSIKEQLTSVHQEVSESLTRMFNEQDTMNDVSYELDEKARELGIDWTELYPNDVVDDYMEFHHSDYVPRISNDRSSDDYIEAKFQLKLEYE
jgi:predicted nuclease with TOPRIM domain